MAFRGQHEHNIDAKDRITVPAAHRAALAGGVVVMESVERCVEVWPAAAAEAMEAAWVNPLSPMGADGRRIRRRVFGTSEQTELDSAGRIRLPKHLIRHGGLSGPSLVVGVGDHLEIWNNPAWEQESEDFEAQAAELTERLAAQGPAAPAGEAGS
jgi:transcriptional regulator MraZ